MERGEYIAGGVDLLSKNDSHNINAKGRSSEVTLGALINAWLINLIKLEMIHHRGTLVKLIRT